MKAVIYARQSSGNEDISESVEAQVSNCLALAEREDFEVIGIFRDMNCSGELYPEGAEKIAALDAAYQEWKQNQKTRKKYRSGLGGVIRKLPEIDLLLVNEMTRLYRPVNNSFLEDYIQNLLRKNHVTVLQVQGGKIDLNQFDQQLILALKNQILYDDLQKKRENSMKAFQNKRNSGKLCCGSRIFGINYLGNDRISVDSERKDIIRLIYSRILQGAALNAIIRECNASAKKMIMYPSLLYSIARQPIYAGYQYDTTGKLIRNTQISGQEFISLEEWNHVQMILSSHRRKGNGRSGKHWLPLSGKLYCGICGRKLVCRIDRGIIYYSCNNQKFNPSATECSKSRIRFTPGTNGEIALYNVLIPILSIGILESWKNTHMEHDQKKSVQNLPEQQKKKEEMFELFLDGFLSEKELKQLIRNSGSSGKQGLFDHQQIRELCNTVYFRQLQKIASGNIDNKLYETLLEQLKLKVTVFENEIQVHTAYGELKIPRIKKRKQRWFPMWKVRICRKNDGLDFVFLTVFVTYYTGEKKEIACFPRLKINSK